MARYFLRFRHSDQGLSPTFTTFKKASDLSVVAPPAITEITVPLNGSYYFDYSPTFDIVFEVDGGVSIPTEEVRFISDTISPRDGYVDEPTSQVKNDVWNDVVDRTVGTKGDYVESLAVIGAINTNVNTANVSLADIKGTGFSTTTDSLHQIRTTLDGIGTGSPASVANAVWDEDTSLHTGFRSFGQTLQQLHAGTAAGGAASTITLAVGASASNNFYNGGLVVLTSGTGVSQARTILSYVGGTRVATVSRAWDTVPVNDDTGYMIVPADVASAPTASANAAAVWDEALAGHSTVGSAGLAIKNSFKILKNRTKINTSLDTLTVYDDDGTTVLYVFNLKDAAGAPSGETPFERVP